jgi:tyrosine-protein phosphatase YwqE
MFSFFSSHKKKKSNGLSFIGTDIHNHLLPGIDDGSPNVDTSMLLMEGMLELGFSAFVCTPHVLGSVHPNTPQTIQEAHHQLQQALDEKGYTHPVKCSAEYMTDFELGDIIQQGQLLPMPGDYILIEMSYALESPNLREVIFDLQTKGYKPILAHPERYPYLYNRTHYYEEIVDAGAELQINLLSLQGYYGKPIQKMAEKLIGMQLISWVGSDLHHSRHLAAMQQLAQNSKAISWIEKIKDLKNPGLLVEAAIH